MGPLHRGAVRRPPRGDRRAQVDRPRVAALRGARAQAPPGRVPVPDHGAHRQGRRRDHRPLPRRFRRPRSARRPKHLDGRRRPGRYRLGRRGLRALQVDPRRQRRFRRAPRHHPEGDGASAHGAGGAPDRDGAPGRERGLGIRRDPPRHHPCPDRGLPARGERRDPDPRRSRGLPGRRPQERRSHPDEPPRLVRLQAPPVPGGARMVQAGDRPGRRRDGRPRARPDPAPARHGARGRGGRLRVARQVRGQRAALHRHPGAEADAAPPARDRARAHRPLRPGRDGLHLGRRRPGAGVVRLQFLPVRHGAGVVPAGRRLDAERGDRLRLRPHAAASEAAASVPRGREPLRRPLREGGRPAVPRECRRVAAALRPRARRRRARTRAARRARGAGRDAADQPGAAAGPAAGRRGRQAPRRTAQRVSPGGLHGERAPLPAAGARAGPGRTRSRGDLRPRARDPGAAPGGPARARRGPDAYERFGYALLPDYRGVDKPEFLSPPAAGTLWQDQQAERGRPENSEAKRFQLPARSAYDTSATTERTTP